MSEPTKPGIEFYGGYEVYSESGVDLTLLRENLKLSLEERIEANSRHLCFAQALRLGRKPERTKEWSKLPDFSRILQQLHALRGEVVLVGGYAMVAQGANYHTQELVLCYARNRTTRRALVSVLTDWKPRLRGSPPDGPPQWNLQAILAGRNFALATDLGFLNLLAEVPGVGGYSQARSRSEMRSVFGCRLPVLSLEGLIAAARAGRTARDQFDLSELEELKKLRDAAP